VSALRPSWVETFQSPSLVLKWGLLLGWLLINAGCASIGRPPQTVTLPTDPSAAWTQRLAELTPKDDWQLRGRLSVDNGKEGFSAGLLWRQNGSDYVIELYDPLGRKTAVLTGDETGAKLQTSKGEQAQAANTEALMNRMLGWSAPVESLRYWVLGIPDPGESDKAVVNLDPQGRLATMQQSDWRLEYQKYQDGPAIQLPVRIAASGQTLKIKLLVKEWQIVPL
jgi:outer membrane lipoprotein LolB